MPTADAMLPAFMWHKSCVLIYSYASDFIVARFMFNGSNLAYFRTISKQIICAITQQIEHTIIMILIYSRLSRQYMRFHNLKHPSDMGAEQVKSFLSWLACERYVAVNTQKVALNALVFMYHKVLKQNLGELDFKLAQKERRLPVVLTPKEVLKILKLLNKLEGRNKTIVEMLYGSGLRVNECLALRMQDICLSTFSVTIRGGKGNKNRHSILS